MTRATWAERRVRTAIPYVSVLTDYEMYALVAKLLLAEHRRAVRVVKKLRQGYVDRNIMASYSARRWKMTTSMS